MIKEQLDNLAAINPNFKVYHTLTRHDEAKDGAWDGLTGRISWEMFQQCGFPAPADDVFVGICGPKAFNEQAKQILAANGYVQGENYP